VKEKTLILNLIRSGNLKIFFPGIFVAKPGFDAIRLALIRSGRIYSVFKVQARLVPEN
jgi:hypothetical protein